MLWKDWDHLSPSEIRNRQGAALHKFLKTQVLPYSPYYKEVFKNAGLTADDIHSVDDLRKIPFTSKIDIAPSKESPGQPRKFVLQPDPKRYASSISLSKKLTLVKNKLLTGQQIPDQVLDEYLPIFFIATTGRTALPTPFLYSAHDMKLFREAARRLFEVGGIRRADDFVVSIFPYAPHLAFWIVYQGGMQTRTPLFHTGGGKVLGTDRIIKMIQALGTTIIVGIPGYVYHLLRIAADRGVDMSGIRMVVLGAERVTRGLKQRLYDLLVSMGAKDPMILSTYGFTEARVAWVECPTPDSISETTRYHIYPDMHIFEIIHPETEQPVGDGESGEIVITSLDWRGSVVLRYRTGDFAKGGITHKACDCCGRTIPRLSTNITRLSDKSEIQLSKIKGTLVDFNEFFPILNDTEGVLEWQVEITKRNNDPHELDVLNLHMTVADGHESNDVIKKVSKVVIERMEVSFETVQLHSVEEITKLLGMEEKQKEDRIKDRRKELLGED